MLDTNDRPSSAMETAVEPHAALRRCPGCHNLVTTRTPLCPVCGKHATVARVASIARWLVILAGTVVAIWWWHHA